MRKIAVFIVILFASSKIFSQNIYPMLPAYYNMDTSHLVKVGRLDFLDTMNLFSPKMPNYITPEQRDSILKSISQENIGVKFCSTIYLPTVVLGSEPMRSAIRQCVREYCKRTKCFSEEVFDPSYPELPDSILNGIELVDSSGLFVHIIARIIPDCKCQLQIIPDQNVFLSNLLLNQIMERKRENGIQLGCFYLDGLLCVVEMTDERLYNGANPVFRIEKETLEINIYKREVEFAGHYGYYSCYYP